MTDEEAKATASADPALEALLTYLKEERGFDFTGYKRASLTRRINRRLQALGLRRYDDYQDHLVMHPGEFATLFNIILINVTRFFRDADVWESLQRELLPRILHTKPTGPLRAWCAGCASGEEAYTLAMVLAEILGIEQFRERVKIYATDVDEEALAVARQATYSSADVEGLPAGLLDRYFEAQGQNYVVVKELRRSVIFGRNDLVQDAPISHVDVLTCRNTLMYFNAETQYQILQRLHFALNPDGVLVLGKAEMLLSQSGLFRSLDLRRRLFAKVVTEPRERRPALSLPGFEPLPAPRLPAEQLSRSAVMFATQAEILLDDQGRLALVNARAASLFGLSPKDVGRPIQDLELSYRPVELRPHLDHAIAERRQVWLRDATLTRSEDEPLFFDVQVLPLSDESGVVLGCAVVYNDVTQFRQLRQELEFANRQLETAYEELQSTNEELETTNEELQSTVEELETTNEELQSTNEELETMNEELQSMNDELQSSNEALREHQDEVERLNQFMSSVLSSLTSGIAVVDKDLRIQGWNVSAEQLWGVRTEEALGQHLFNLDIGLPLERLGPLLRQQLSGDGDDHAAIRLAAVNRRGRHVEVQVTVARLLPTGDGQDGAIVAMDVLRPAAAAAVGSGDGQ